MFIINKKLSFILRYRELVYIVFIVISYVNNVVEEIEWF